MYNFTVFDVNLNEATCYSSHERLPKRRSNEAGSILFKSLQNIAEGKTFRYCPKHGGSRIVI
jgi:hypothetical protein